MGWSPFSFIAACLLGSALAWAEPQSYQYDSASGQWVASQPKSPTSAPAANPLLDRAQQWFDGRRYPQVHDLVLDWLKKNPLAADRDRAILLLAEVYYVTGDRPTAFYQCDELLDNFPDSKLFFPALELQFRIANGYLSGYRENFFGLPIVPMEETAVDMLFRIQERAPGSPIAERALLRTADYYYNTSTFDLAVDAYGAFLRIYPRSPSVARVRLRQAHANFARYHGPRYDATPLLDARAEFQVIQTATPDLARDEGVQQFIDRIDEQLSAKLFSDADYYKRVNQPAAAVFVYRSLIQRYPNSRDADAARKILESMPVSALRQPWPPESAGQMPAPTTAPILGP